MVVRLCLLMLLGLVPVPAFAEAGAGGGGGDGVDAARILELELRRQLAQARAQGEAPADGPVAPGRADPVAPTSPFAFEVDWDDYRTLIVVEPGRELRRPAWVATRHKGADDLAVAYAGTAFLDARGDLHIDCRGAHISGPMADQWSPDSFAIEDGGHVRIIDDADRGNPGRVAESIPARVAAGAGLTRQFQRARILARLYVEGAL